MSASQSSPSPAAENAASYRLRYFDGRGLGEIARLVFTIAKVEFVDERYSFHRNADGSVLRPEWDANKDNRALFPFAKMPVLQLADGTIIPQSRAIERFLAKRFGMFGSNDVEAALVDALIEQLNDVRKAYNDAKWKQDEGATLRNFIARDLPPFLALFEGWLQRRAAGKTAFFVGDKLSLADVIVYYFLWTLENGQDFERSGVADALKHTPLLATLKNGIAAIPHLAEYVAKRPQTAF